MMGLEFSGEGERVVGYMLACAWVGGTELLFGSVTEDYCGE